MKIVFLTVLFSLLGIGYTYGQSAVYVCGETGAWGATYNDGNGPKKNMYTIKEAALEKCEEMGGTNCQFFYSFDCTDCWGAFIIGSDGYTFNYLAVYSGSSKSETIAYLKKQYKEAGGVAASTAEVTTWYIPE